MRVVVGLVVGLTACGRVDFRESPPASDAPLEAFGMFGSRQPLPQLDTNVNDADPTLTDDQLEMYLSSDRPGMGETDIYRSRRAAIAEPWGAPERIVELSSAKLDDSPEISGDGLTIYLTSTRATTSNAVFVATRADREAAWSSPVMVPELTSGQYDTNIGISGDGLIAIVEHESVPGNYDLFEHRRASLADSWGPERLVTELASPMNESGQCVDEHGLVVYFTSNRTGTQGLYDIYTAARPTLDDPFSVPVRVDAIDTTSDDGNPFLTRDGHTIYWASDRLPGLGARDLWFATR